MSSLHSILSSGALKTKLMVTMKARKYTATSRSIEATDSPYIFMTDGENDRTNSKAQNTDEEKAEKDDSSKSSLLRARYKVRRHECQK